MKNQQNHKQNETNKTLKNQSISTISKDYLITVT